MQLFMGKTHGFILMMTLIFLFVLTLIAVSGNNDIILQNKMQSDAAIQGQVFAQAELGLQKKIFQLIGKSFSLPNSPIKLHVLTKKINVDACGNKTINISSVATYLFSTVNLNTLVRFAKVPRERYCKKVKAYQILWWREGAAK